MLRCRCAPVLNHPIAVPLQVVTLHFHKLVGILCVCTDRAVLDLFHGKESPCLHPKPFLHIGSVYSLCFHFGFSFSELVEVPKELLRPNIPSKNRTALMGHRWIVPQAAHRRVYSWVKLVSIKGHCHPCEPHSESGIRRRLDTLAGHIATNGNHIYYSSSSKWGAIYSCHHSANGLFVGRRVISSSSVPHVSSTSCTNRTGECSKYWCELRIWLAFPEPNSRTLRVFAFLM